MAGGHSEVRLLLCDGCNGPIALEFGVTVINHHRPWACPKLAPHFQVSAGDRQLPEFLGRWKGEELSESGCWGPGACLGLSQPHSGHSGAMASSDQGLGLSSAIQNSVPGDDLSSGSQFLPLESGENGCPFLVFGEELGRLEVLACTWPAAGDQDERAIVRADCPTPSLW